MDGFFAGRGGAQLRFDGNDEHQFDGYEYDFGDGWLHSVDLVAVHPQTSRLATAVCLDGARACPPEDCGGPPGYEQLLETVANPKAPDHAEMKEWLGEFDSAAFNLAATNRALARIKL